ncbi:MAG: YegS/Rv2252/BmrU family lipid kinase [Bacteroidota bacterium]
MKTLFLINPGSGRKRDAVQTEALIKEVYGDADQDAKIQQIDFERLDSMLDEAEALGYQRVFAVGGDGTVNAVGAKMRYRPLALGIIPSGSGNGYARNLGYSVNTRLALRQSLDAQALTVDTGMMGDRPFLNVAGIGFDAEVAHAFSLGKNRGFGPYVMRSAEGLLQLQGQEYQLTIDGEKHLFEKIIGIAVANGTQWGYDAKVNARASLNDGFFDLLVVRKFPLVKAPAIVSKMFNGRFQNSNYVKVFQAKNILIEPNKSGFAQVDGEPFEQDGPMEIKMLEKSLQILLPSTLTEQKIQSL